MISRYIEIPQKSAFLLHVLRITILVLAFIGTPLFSIHGLLFYGFCTLIVMISYMHIGIRKFDNLQKWTGLFLLITLFVLVFQDWSYHPLRIPAVLSMSLITITAISILGVNSDDFFYSLIIAYILSIYVMNEGSILDNINNFIKYISVLITTGKIHVRNIMPMPTTISLTGMIGVFYFAFVA